MTAPFDPALALTAERSHESGLEAGMEHRQDDGALRRELMQGQDSLYLQILGVSTALQGQGYGAKLLRALIGECERSGKALYLETETEGNVLFYERFGFVVARRITLPVVDLSLWLMVRRAGNPLDDH